MKQAFYFNHAAWRARRREENKRIHAAARQLHAPGWDETLPLVVFSISEVAKRMERRRGEFFKTLEVAGWIRWNPDLRSWAACQMPVSQGWMATRRKTIGWKRYVLQPVITPTGWAKLTTSTDWEGNKNDQEL